MTSWCSEILSSIHDDSSWQASIFMASSIFDQRDFYQSNLNVTNHQNNPIQSVSAINEIDIIKLYTQSESVKDKLCQTALTHNYPKSALFHFEAYGSFNEKDNLVEFIKKKACKKGTYLVIKSTKKAAGTEKNYEITLSCQHYGTPKKSTAKTLHFNTNALQASDTLIEPKHHGTPRKGRSRSSRLKRVKKCSDTDETKTNKCQKLKCGCTFSITIFFHHISQRWFLKKKLNNFDSQMHVNHIWITPNHNYVSKKDLTEVVKDTIYELIQCGSNDTNIKIYVFSQYKIHVKGCNYIQYENDSYSTHT